jgi:rhodanese-related sulfurtransferase
MKTLTTEDVNKLHHMEEPFVLINVLPAKSFSETEIPGAVNVPLEEPDFLDRVETLAGGKSNPVITYCANESCPASTEAAQKLEAAGFTNVFDYKAGAEGWKNEREQSEERSGARMAPSPSMPAFRA